MGQQQLPEGGEALKRRHKNMTPHANVTIMKQVLTYRRGRFNIKQPKRLSQLRSARQRYPSHLFVSKTNPKQNQTLT
jgi:hypothetical protein